MYIKSFFRTKPAAFKKTHFSISKIYQHMVQNNPLDKCIKVTEIFQVQKSSLTQYGIQNLRNCPQKEKLSFGP